MVSDDYRRCARCVMDTDEPVFLSTPRVNAITAQKALRDSNMAFFR